MRGGGWLRRLPAAAPIAVETPITERPPHRSVRAQFGHTAPTLGLFDGKALLWPWMKDSWGGEPSSSQFEHTLPRQFVFLAAPS